MSYFDVNVFQVSGGKHHYKLYSVPFTVSLSKAAFFFFVAYTGISCGKFRVEERHKNCSSTV
jgi:hypothetical protein